MNDRLLLALFLRLRRRDRALVLFAMAAWVMALAMVLVR